MAKGDLTITLNERDYRDLMKRLNSLEDVDKRNAISKALRMGVRVIMNAGKANYKARDLHTGKTGNLKRSFAIKLDKKRKVSFAGFKHPGGNHSFLVSRGTKARYTSRGYYRGTVQKRGPNTGNRFWDDAVKDNGGKALETLMDTVYEEVRKCLNRGV